MAITSGYSLNDLVKMGPSEIERQMALAAALRQQAGGDGRVDDPLEGVAMMANALFAGLGQRKAEKASLAGKEGAGRRMADLAAALGGGGQFPKAPGGGGQAGAPMGSVDRQPMRPVRDTAQTGSTIDFANVQPQSKPAPDLGDASAFVDPSTNPSINAAVLKRFGGKQLPVSIRNNNMGAISITGDIDSSWAAKQPGFIGTSPRPASEGGYYAKYATPEHGVAAASNLLEQYGRQGRNTPLAITSKWAAEPGDYPNVLVKYLKAAGYDAGVNTPLDMSDPNVRVAILKAKSAHESGAGVPVYADEVFDRAVRGGGAPAEGQSASQAINAFAAQPSIQESGGAGVSPQAQMAQALMGGQPPAVADTGMPDMAGNAGPIDTVNGPSIGQLFDVAGNEFLNGGQRGLVEALLGQKLKGPGEGFTLGEGQVRYDAQGRPIATGGQKPPDENEVFDNISKLRTEVQALPSYKNLSQAAPIYRSMLETAGRDSRASDLNLVYGLGKIMDPTSVVREGEMVMVKNTASLPDWLQGAIASLNGGAALTPETRKAIMTEAFGRVGGYKQQFDQDAEQYKGIVERNRFNPNDVLPNIGAFEEWAGPPAAAPGEGTPAAPPSPADEPPATFGLDKDGKPEGTPEERREWWKYVSPEDRLKFQ